MRPADRADGPERIGATWVEPALAAGSAAVALLMLAGCATDPKKTVMNLDTTDPSWTSPECVAARKAVYRFNDHHNLGTIVGAVGNALIPFAGAGADLALTGGQQRKREELNDWVLDACVSNPRKAERLEAESRHRVVAALDH